MDHLYNQQKIVLKLRALLCLRAHYLTKCSYLALDDLAERLPVLSVLFMYSLPILSIAICGHISVIYLILVSLLCSGMKEAHPGISDPFLTI